MSLPEYDPSNIDFATKTVVKLVNNYRNHPLILKYPNDQFYAGELIPLANASTTDAVLGWAGWNNPSFLSAGPVFPIIFHALKGGEDREGNSPSFYNALELTQVKHYVDRMRTDAGVQPHDIGKLRLGLRRSK